MTIDINSFLCYTVTNLKKGKTMNAKQAREMTIAAIKARQVTFKEAISALDHEIATSAASGIFTASVAFEYWMEDQTIKKVKNYLKKEGFKFITVEEDYISCSW